MILGGHIFINVCLCAHIVGIGKSKRRNLNLVATQLREGWTRFNIVINNKSDYNNLDVDEVTGWVRISEFRDLL